MVEVGYTIEPETRKYNDKNQTNSNEFMNLFEAAGGAVLNAALKYEDTYEMRWHTLYQITSQSETGISEHLLSRLAGAYVARGELNVSVGGVRIESSMLLGQYVWDHGAKKTQQQMENISAAYETELDKVRSEWDATETIAEGERKATEVAAGKEKRDRSRSDLANAEGLLPADDEKTELEAGRFLQVANRDIKGLHSAQLLSDHAGELNAIMKELWRLESTAED